MIDVRFHAKAPAGVRFTMTLRDDDNGVSYVHPEVGTGAWQLVDFWWAGEGEDVYQRGTGWLSLASPASNGDLLVDNVLVASWDFDGNDSGILYDTFESGFGNWIRTGPKVSPVTEDTAPPGTPTSAGGLTWKESLVYGMGQLISEERTAGTLYVLGDQVQSSNIVVDGNGVVKGLSKNLPFGERFGSWGETSARRFTNHLGQPGSPIYMQARMYLPVFGRFAQVDPEYDQKVYSKDSWNLYGYVANNPVASTDPTGMQVQEARMASTAKHDKGLDEDRE